MGGGRGAPPALVRGCCWTWRRTFRTDDCPGTDSASLRMLTSLGVSPSTTCFIILGAAVALFIWNRLPIGIVAIAVTLSLWATGVLTLNQAFAGFGDPVVIFIASLFVVSEALDATGVQPGSASSRSLESATARFGCCCSRCCSAGGPERVDHAEWRRRGADADGRRAGRPTGAVAVAVADAPGLWGPRGLAADPDRHADQRDCLGGGERTPDWVDLASSSTHSSASRCCWVRSPSWCCSASGCCRSGRRSRFPRTWVTTRGPWSSSTVYRGSGPAAGGARFAPGRDPARRAGPGTISRYRNGRRVRRRRRPGHGRRFPGQRRAGGARDLGEHQRAG